MLKPADVFPEGKAPALSVIARIDQIPEGLKKAFLAQVEMGVAKEKSKKQPNETKEQAAVRTQAMDQVFNGINSLVKEGGPVSFDLDVDRKAENISLQVSFAGKPNTGLAKAISN